MPSSAFLRLFSQKKAPMANNASSPPREYEPRIETAMRIMQTVATMRSQRRSVCSCSQRIRGSVTTSANAISVFPEMNPPSGPSTMPPPPFAIV